MSTNSTIVLKLKPEDVGRIKRCDTNKIPVKKKKTYRYEILPNMDILNDVLKGVKLPEYLEIYHHFDGYPTYLGEYLNKHYNTYEKVLNLVLIGDVSSIIHGVVPYIGFSNSREKGWEKRKWEDNRAYKSDNLPDQTQQYQYYAVPDEKNPDKVKWFWRENKTWHDLKSGQFCKL